MDGKFPLGYFCLFLASLILLGITVFHSLWRDEGKLNQLFSRTTVRIGFTIIGLSGLAISAKALLGFG